MCVEFDNISATNHWQSVGVTGHYDELPKDREHVDERLAAYELLGKTAEWWEPACVKTVVHDHVREMEPVYFRILITEKTGHKAKKVGIVQTIGAPALDLNC